MTTERFCAGLLTQTFKIRTATDTQTRETKQVESVELVGTKAEMSCLADVGETWIFF